MPKKELESTAATDEGVQAAAEQENDAETSNAVVSSVDLRAALAAAERSTLDSAVAPGENVALNGYIPVAGQSMTVRANVHAYLNAEDLSQQMTRLLRYDQMIDSAAILMELELYDYPNPQLPYLEDMMELELLSADGDIINTMSGGLFELEGFEPMSAVQGQAVIPGLFIVEVGQKEPAYLRLVTFDESGRAQTAYLALPDSDPASMPELQFAPKPIAIGDTVT